MLRALNILLTYFLRDYHNPFDDSTGSHLRKIVERSQLQTQKVYKAA